jgi:hypothetical protein
MELSLEKENKLAELILKHSIISTDRQPGLCDNEQHQRAYIKLVFNKKLYHQDKLLGIINKHGNNMFYKVVHNDDDENIKKNNIVDYQWNFLTSYDNPRFPLDNEFELLVLDEQGNLPITV